MMASFAEQRRFLMQLDKVPSSKLNQIIADLMELDRNQIASEQDLDFLRKCQDEQIKRENLSGID